MEENIEFEILETKPIKVEDKWKHELHLCRVPAWDNAYVIRPCYYIKQKNKEGDDHWHFIPRPLTFGMDEVNKVISAIAEFKEMYDIKHAKNAIMNQ